MRSYTSFICLHLNLLPAAARVLRNSPIMFKTIIFLSCVVYCESVYVYSSFWEPLFNPRILNYRVDANFDPESGRNAREMYEKKNGYRGEQLIADLGNGKGLKDHPQVNQGYGDVKFYYTYPGASNKVQ